MAHTVLFFCLVSTVSGRNKNALGRGSASNRHIKNLSNLDFLLISMSLKKTRQVGRVNQSALNANIFAPATNRTNIHSKTAGTCH